MKTLLLLCLTTLLASTLCAQTPARKLAASTRKTAQPTRQPNPAKAVQPPLPAANPQRAKPATARQQTIQPVQAKQTLGSSSIQFGIVAGGTLASLNYNGTNGSQTFNITSPTRLGFHAGALVDIPLGTHLSVQPGLLYVMKGSGESTDKSDVFTDLSMSYVELPVTLFYRIPAGSGTFRIGLGGYAAYGLSGSYTIAKQTIPVKFGSDESQTNPLDYGARIAAQFQMGGGVLLGANYSFGAGNLINKADNETLTNRAISFSVGYVFGGKR